MLEEIEQLREELRHHVGPQQRWTKQLRRNLTARAIAGSNTIEGSHPDDELVPVYTAPDKDAVPGLMAELIAWLNDGDLESPVHVRASMAYLNLVKIHPWADGNGRMSRALSTLVFARGALMPVEFSSIEEWLGRGQNTFAYYAVLELMGGPEWNPTTNTSQRIKFCLTAHHRQAQGAQRRVELLSRAWIRLADEAERYGLDERATYALLPASLGQKVRRKLYQIDAELSEQQSIRDMRQMVTLGWLDSHGEARGRYYTAGPLMLPVTAEVGRETKPFINPYRRRDD